jgi:hypothetical protein
MERSHGYSCKMVFYFIVSYLVCYPIENCHDQQFKLTATNTVLIPLMTFLCTLNEYKKNISGSNLISLNCAYLHKTWKHITMPSNIDCFQRQKDHSYNMMIIAVYYGLRVNYKFKVQSIK